MNTISIFKSFVMARNYVSQGKCTFLLECIRPNIISYDNIWPSGWYVWKKISSPLSDSSVLTFNFFIARWQTYTQNAINCNTGKYFATLRKDYWLLNANFVPLIFKMPRDFKAPVNVSPLIRVSVYFFSRTINCRCARKCAVYHLNHWIYFKRIVKKHSVYTNFKLSSPDKE